MPFAKRFSFLIIALAFALSACGNRARSAEGKRVRELTFAAYTTPREAYREILRAFETSWEREHPGEDLRIRESYQASGAQARAVASGFDADVIALSLEKDIESVRSAGLITHDWKAASAHGGMVTSSVVVLAVRAGNPKAIRDWADLRRSDVQVLTPNVRTSGGAMWNVAAIWGAALRGKAGISAGDEALAQSFLGEILARVRIMDRSGRDSMLTFERGIGDVAITYENEVLLGRSQGRDYEYVVPSSSILIENPVALVDRNVDRHQVRDIASALVDFLRQPQAQRIYARHGLRPLEPSVVAETAAQFPAVQDLFTVRDLGGWPRLERTLFAEGGAYEHAVQRVANR